MMTKQLCLFLLIFVLSSCQQQAPAYQWKPYSKQAVEDSMAQRKPIVIDFFAQWCPICHELDREVFSQPEIQAKLSKVTALRVDITDQDDPQVQKIAQEYGIEGLPTIVFLDSNGQEINNSRVMGFVTPQEFAQALALSQQ
jgi:thiol:disulfide interchange protein DsbD